MKVETRQYKYLKNLIGKEIIRIKPCECSYGTDYSYTADPVRLLSVSKDELRYQARWRSSPDVMNAEWLDGNWYSLEDAMRFPKIKLNELQGKMIHLKKKQFISGAFFDYPAKLVLATKYHVVLDKGGTEWWISNLNIDPNEWQEA